MWNRIIGRYCIRKRHARENDDLKLVGFVGFDNNLDCKSFCSRVCVYSWLLVVMCFSVCIVYSMLCVYIFVCACWCLDSTETDAIDSKPINLSPISHALRLPGTAKS